jgi:hypothetical protein
MISARIGTTIEAERTIAAAKSCFFIIFNILAYPDPVAQVAQQPGYAAEHAPLGPRIFLGRPQDLVTAEA